MKTITVLALGTIGLVLGSVPVATPATGTADATPRRLEHAARSRDELIARFIAALRDGDASALRRLRVTEHEYRDLVLPGTVAPGQPLRRWPDDVTRYFWDVLNDRSTYSEGSLIETFGKRPYTVRSVAFAGGEQRYATYRAHKQLELVLGVEGDPTRAGHLRTGSVIEVDGQFKFVSFVRD